MQKKKTALDLNYHLYQLLLHFSSSINESLLGTSNLHLVLSVDIAELVKRGIVVRIIPGMFTIVLSREELY